MQNQQQQQQGRGRGLHIAHRRTPSELTPLMIEQLALQQQMEMLQAQQQQILAQQQQFAQAGLLGSQGMQTSPAIPQMPGFMPSPNQGFGFPGVSQTQMAPGNHRRAQSSVPGFQMMGSSVTGSKSLMYEPNNNGGRNQSQQRLSNGQGHTRRHSLALPEAKRAAQLAQQQKQAGSSQPASSGNIQTTSNFQFPPSKPSAVDNSSASKMSRHTHSRSQGTNADFEELSRSPQPSGFSFPHNNNSNGSGYNDNNGGHSRTQSHSRSGSRNFDGDWRRSSAQQQSEAASGGLNQQQPQQQQQQQFFPGHRSRGSMSNSMSSQSSFSASTYQPGVIPLFTQQQINAGQSSQPPPAMGQMPGRNMVPDFISMHPQMNFPSQPLQNNQQQNQQQRKSLFLPYLTQASIPALVAEGRLVTGILRVNKKNRSDAYVSTDGLLDADIYICGSKDRNRALEGDLVAVELLTVDEVWGSKREKEEKKKRKEGEDNQPGLQRRGSLRTRPIQKKNDDVEVEGQGLLLVEEDEISDTSKPLYAGHIVAVIERIPGQVYSGSLGLLRPSSQAAKEKQESEKKDDNRHENSRNDKPKIVWFKPTDKRVPLIAIPTEQAPKDFVENHEKYSNTVFVASIKRWPITSLHPFGMLIESLGPATDHSVEINAILRDNNFMNDQFTDSVLNGLPALSKLEDTGVNRRSFADEHIVALCSKGSKYSEQAVHIRKVDDSTAQIGVHITDASFYVQSNTPLDREAKQRGTSVFMMDKTVPMLPDELLENYLSLSVGKSTFAFSVVLDVNLNTFDISNLWLGKSTVTANAMVSTNELTSEDSAVSETLDLLGAIAKGFRRRRLNAKVPEIPSLNLLDQLEDERIPAEVNIFERKQSSALVDEIMIKINSIIASILVQKLGDRSLLRRHSPPNAHRLESFLEKMSVLGLKFDGSSSAKLQNSLFQIDDPDKLKGLETLLLKTFSRAKYFVAGKVEQRSDYMHYLLNLPVYTTFTSPTRRYADILVHRQLESILYNKEYTPDLETLSKLADHCNDRKDAAKNAEEQSIHLFLCEAISNLSASTGQLIRDAVVVSVYESAFDVLIPEFGVEKRVHCDQLPLVKAEFDKQTRCLELYWEKGVDSATYVPEDERDRVSDYNGGSQRRASSITSAVAQDSQRIDIASLTLEDRSPSEDGENGEKPVASKSLPGSPVKRSPSRALNEKPTRTASMTKMNAIEKEEAADAGALAAYLGDVVSRINGEELIQEIRELTHVPVLLRADIGKSLPCLTVRTLNPFAT
ncbi:hypothetical protein BZA70DRAFT_22662 [Myxozyma melibiosi]|uniref:RNB domain-containing protein n=1 Tax=Myxozyma melibiosi TaxID=54550 RepID=A0ABR1FCY1_9ASCO